MPGSRPDRPRPPGLLLDAPPVASRRVRIAECCLQPREHDAIRSWKKETQTKYKYVIEPPDASVSGKTVKLRARLMGNFPGSPADLEYTFTFANGKITSLEIG